MIGGRGEVDDLAGFGEGGEAGGYRAVGRGDEAAAVEDQLVVAADGVAIDHGHGEVAGEGGDDAFAQVSLARIPGTGGEVDQEVDALAAEQGDGVHLVQALVAGGLVGPDVLADGHADAEAGVVHDGGGLGGLEVAVLVKHVVGGEQAFFRDLLYATVLAKGGGVEGAPAGGRGVGDDGADEQRNLAGGGGELGGGVFHVAHEAAAQQEVARRVAADGELGGDDQLGPGGDEFVVGGEQATEVAGEIADGGIELGEADAHGRKEPEGWPSSCG